MQLFTLKLQAMGGFSSNCYGREVSVSGSVQRQRKRGAGKEGKKTKVCAVQARALGSVLKPSITIC